MLPMVSLPRELAAARAMLDEEVAALLLAGVPARRASLGIMVEVPAAAIAADQFDADFFSIGSNDPTQSQAAPPPDLPARAHPAGPGPPGELPAVPVQRLVGP